MGELAAQFILEFKIGHPELIKFIAESFDVASNERSGNFRSHRIELMGNQNGLDFSVINSISIVANYQIRLEFF